MKIILIGCGKKKNPVSQNKALPANEVYTGALFKKAWKLADDYREKHNNVKIFILSAKYGLLDPYTKIKYYDKTLNHQKKEHIIEWSKSVLSQMEDMGLSPENDDFVFLCGKNYYSELAKIGGFATKSFPFKDYKGIGYILGALTNNLIEL